MTQSEIRRKRLEIEGRIKKACIAYQLAQKELKGLQEKCRHPEKVEFPSGVSGEITQECKDCGKLFMDW